MTTPTPTGPTGHLEGLRDYQVAAVGAVRSHWASDPPSAKDPLLVMSTGTGKTRTARALISETLAAGGRVAVLAHRRELLEQFAALFPQGVSGLVQGARNDAAARVVCASVATLRQPDRVAAILAAGPIDLIIVDEAHHTPSSTHAIAVAALRTPGRTRLLGLTATPDREDGADLGALFEIVYDYGTVAAVRDGWLVPPYAAVARLPGFDAAAHLDLSDEELGDALLAAHIVPHTVAAVLGTHNAARLPQRDDVRRMSAAERSILVFTASVRQARLTAEALTEAGVEARFVTGGSGGGSGSGGRSGGTRGRLLDAFAAGRLRALVNPVVLTEGTDLPRADCVVLARPFLSWSLYVQAVGRGLRLHHDAWDDAWGLMNAHHSRYRDGGKGAALVLDLAGATETHSLVAAPVLISGPICEHQWERVGDTHAGRCAVLECGARCACFALRGPHAYDPATGLCTAQGCGAPQCEASPIHLHLWQAMDDGVRRECCFCGVTTRDTHAALCGRRSSVPVPVPPDAWLEVERDVWALVVRDYGTLYTRRAGQRTTDAGRVEYLRDLWWLAKGARTLRPMNRRPVTQAEAGLLAADVCRKVERFTADADRRPVSARTRAFAERSRREHVIAGVATEAEARRALSTVAVRERWAALRPPLTTATAVPAPTHTPSSSSASPAEVAA
jgi:superfamily II DNA or RNA helicase